MKTTVYNANGEKIKDIELKPEVFEQKINKGLIYQIIRAEMMNDRQGTVATKTRGLVRGGGIKPWKQKGTGRARAGSIRSPLFVGGGTIFGPQPKNYSLKVPKKMRNAAIKSILSAKAKDNEIIIVDKLDFKEPKTKSAVNLLDKLKAGKKSTFLVEEIEVNLFKSFSNLQNAAVISMAMLSAYNVIDNDKLIITSTALDKLTEVLS